MQRPDYLLPRPAFEVTSEMKDSFDDLWQVSSAGRVIDYRLSYPKWQFLSYLCDTRGLVLHGSQHLSIDTVEPRQANDKREYSDQYAIYATTDGIWVIYFAIIDRRKYPQVTLFNLCLSVRLSEKVWSEPMYFFSITHRVLQLQPWCQGMIYILPRQSFEQEPAQTFNGIEIIFPHWISKFPSKPIARLPVGPSDFPFLGQIHGHNDERLSKLATENPAEFPWPGALES